MTELGRVVTCRLIMGICHMQVCAVSDATDEEILAHCNIDNPSGAAAGWDTVIRAPQDELAPVPCDDNPTTRLHIIVGC